MSSSREHRGLINILANHGRTSPRPERLGNAPLESAPVGQQTPFLERINRHRRDFAYFYRKYARFGRRGHQAAYIARSAAVRRPEESIALPPNRVSAPPDRNNPPPSQTFLIDEVHPSSAVGPDAQRAEESKRFIRRDPRETIADIVDFQVVRMPSGKLLPLHTFERLLSPEPIQRKRPASDTELDLVAATEQPAQAPTESTQAPIETAQAPIETAQAPIEIAQAPTEAAQASGETVTAQDGSDNKLYRYSNAVLSRAEAISLIRRNRLAAAGQQPAQAPGEPVTIQEGSDNEGDSDSDDSASDDSASEDSDSDDSDSENSHLDHEEAMQLDTTEGVVGSVFKMFSGVSNALTGFGQKLTELVSTRASPQSTAASQGTVAEIRNERPDGNVANKRRRLEDIVADVAEQPTPAHEAQQPAPAHEAQQPAPVHEAQQPALTHEAQQPALDEGAYWLSEEDFQPTLDKAQHTHDAFSQLCQLGTVPMTSLHDKVNKILRPLKLHLAGTPANPSLLVAAHDSSTSLCDLYGLFTQKLLKIMTWLYNSRLLKELAFVRRLKSSNCSLRMRHKVQDDDELLKFVKDVLSVPSLHIVMTEIAEVCKVHPRDIGLDGTTEDFIDAMILDMEAVVNNVIPPSLLHSPLYLQSMKTKFPAPTRGPFQFPMPGAFPEEPSDDDQQHAQPELEQQALREHAVAPAPSLNDPEQENLGPDHAPATSSGSDDPSKAPKEPIEPPPVIARFKPARSKTAHMREWDRYFRVREVRHDRTEEEEEAYQAIKAQYIVDFESRDPMLQEAIPKLASILRNRPQHPSRKPPKRLTMHNMPKRVHFTPTTFSPKPRSHTRTEVPRLREPMFGYDSRLRNVRPALTFSAVSVPASYSPTPRNHASSPSPSPPPPETTKQQGPIDAAEKERAHRRALDALDAFFDEPSLVSLRLSDAVSEAITKKREEEARLAAEAAEAAEKAAKAAAEKAKLEEEARLARTGGLRPPRQPLVQPLSTEWVEKIKETLRASPSAMLATTGEGTEIRRHDFAKVVPSTEWLNDEIVNGSLNWLDKFMNTAAGVKDPKKQTRKCLAMGSFFIKQLKERGPESTVRTLRRYGVHKENLLDIDTILLPICERMHWTLLVIRPSKRTVSHMDSMRPGASIANTELALGWMKTLLQDKFVQDEWKIMHHEAPRQTNGWDCGVHTVTNAMCLTLGLNPIKSYTVGEMPLQRLRIAGTLLNSGFHGDFDLGAY